MNNQKRIYRIATEWVQQLPEKSSLKHVTEDLVVAESYTEAESMAYALVENDSRIDQQTLNFTITKTKINDVEWNEVWSNDTKLVLGKFRNYFSKSDDTGVGLYAVSVVYLTLDEKTGKEKKSKEVIYMPANSSADAYDRTDKKLKKWGETRPYVIRSVKFDKAESIVWDIDTQKQKEQEMQ